MAFRKIVSSVDEKNKRLSDSVEDVIRSFFPMKGKASTLELKSLKTEQLNGSYSRTKKAISSKTSVMSKMFATLVLKDKNGKVLDKDTVPIAMVPVFTRKNSYIIDGGSYNVINQQRLKNGIYTYKRGDGIIYSTVKPKNGREFKFFIDHSDKLKLSTSSKNYKAFAVLKGFGVRESELEAILGKEILGRNSTAGDNEEYNRFIKDVMYKDDTPLGFDKDVLKKTIGINSSSISKQVLLGTIKKLVKVNKKEKDEDEPTNMIFKTIRTGPELIAEQYKKSLKDSIANIRFKLFKGETKKVKDLIGGTNTFTKPLKSTIVMSKLSRIPDEYNPINSMMYNYLITPMGEGGVGDTKALTLDHKAIHHSQLGFIDPIVSPEGANVGITLAVTEGAYVDDDGEPAMSVINTKTGKREIKTLKSLWDKKVLYPITGKAKTDGIYARVGNKDIKLSSKKLADYEIPSPTEMHSPSSNFIPLLNSIDANRTNMAQKHIQQALPIVDADIPHVGVLSHTGKSTGEDIANISGSVIRSDFSGVVSKIDDEYIHIKTPTSTEKIEYATDVPFSTKTFLSHKLVVKKGDKVKKGQLLADSNFTKDGEIAIGKNLNLAWMSMPGNRNDGVVISESASTKLTSGHLYKETVSKSSDDILDLRKALLLFPSLKDKINPQNFDSNGVVKKGVILKKNDPIAIVLSPNSNREIKSKLTSVIQKPYRAVVTTWKKTDNGEVLNSTVKGSSIVIETKVFSKAKIGDKLSARAGNKGIISRIVPDDEMPRRENGDIIDVALTSAGVVTRINPGVVEEGALGRIAEKKGANINIPHYGLGNNLSEVKNSFGKEFGGQKETLINPETGKPFPTKIFVGRPYIIKLFKDSEGATSSVGVGSTDEGEQATKGGKESASSISGMEVNSALAHNAYGLLKEIRDVKGQKNDRYFESVMSGSHFTPNTKTPYAMDKFVALLGQFNVDVDVNKDSKSISTRIATTKDVIANSFGEVKVSDTINLKKKTAVKNGLFDDRIFGGVSGSKQGHINLGKKILNPLTEEENATLLGMSKKQLEHDIGIGKTKELVGKLESLNVDNEIRRAKSIISSSDSTDKANKEIRVLKMLSNVKSSDKKISDITTLSAVPVIAPKYRPISVDKNEISMDGLNVLYRDIIDIAKESKGVKDGSLDKDLYLSLGALYGTHKSPNPDIDSETTKGILDILKGVNPKQSYAQSKLLRKKQFMSGRAVIKPARTDIGIDEIELPETVAMNMYSPHVHGILARKGMSTEEIEESMLNKDDLAMQALKSSIDKYPTYYTRSPALWKHNLAGAKAKLVKGSTIGFHPLNERGQNADYDGDQIGIYATVTEEAAKDVREKLFPSKHLFTEDSNVANPDLLIMPDQDSTLGFFKASSKSGKKAVRVASIQELLKKLKSGEIDYNDQVLM